MEPLELKNDKYFIIKHWARQNPNLTVGFTTKNDGKSHFPYDSANFAFHVGDEEEIVCKNRQDFANTLQFPLHNWVGAEQTHENFIKKVTSVNKGKGAFRYSDSFKRTDGFYTFEKGILLTLCFADCVPLYFFAPKQRALGIAHAGWRGSVSNISGEMIHCLKKEGIKEDEIFVVIGPSICEKCYIVDDLVISQIERNLAQGEERPYHEVKDGQYSLNLRSFNRQLLLKAGIPAENIETTNFCTSCHHQQFFSHRRDQGITGRMMSFIGWKEGNNK